MKFNVSSKALYNMASSVSKIITKSPIPILQNFLITLDGSMLSIKGQDMENSIEGRMEVMEAEGSGSFCLDALRLVELLKLMPDQGMEISVSDKNELVINYPNGCFEAMVLPSNDFPAPIEGQEETLSFNLPMSMILSGTETTQFAVGTDDIRPQLMGVLWDVKTDKIIFVATDTRKLVRYTDSNVQPGIDCSFIVSGKCMNILKTVFAKADDVNIKVSESRAVFECANYTFDCALIKGRFPDYNRVIPQNNPYTLTVDGSLFLSAARRVAVGGDEGSNLIRFNFDSDGLMLDSTDPGYNTKGWERVPCSFDGPTMKIGFDSSYVTEILSSLPMSDIIMKIGDPSRPALLQPSENAEGIDQTIILMPMNIA